MCDATDRSEWFEFLASIADSQGKMVDAADASGNFLCSNTDCSAAWGGDPRFHACPACGSPGVRIRGGERVGVRVR